MSFLSQFTRLVPCFSESGGMSSLDSRPSSRGEYGYAAPPRPLVWFAPNWIGFVGFESIQQPLELLFKITDGLQWGIVSRFSPDKLRRTLWWIGGLRERRLGGGTFADGFSNYGTGRVGVSFRLLRRVIAVELVSRVILRVSTRRSWKIRSSKGD